MLTVQQISDTCKAILSPIGQKFYNAVRCALEVASYILCIPGVTAESFIV